MPIIPEPKGESKSRVAALLSRKAARLAPTIIIILVGVISFWLGRLSATEHIQPLLPEQQAQSTASPE